MVVDEALDVDSIQGYAPYGEPLEAGGFGSPFTFTGELTDANDLLYLRARYYSPALGVFTALDPVEDLNRYQYVSANPTNWVDPSGEIMKRPEFWNGCSELQETQHICSNPTAWLNLEHGSLELRSDTGIDWYTAYQGERVDLCEGDHIRATSRGQSEAYLYSIYYSGQFYYMRIDQNEIALHDSHDNLFREHVFPLNPTEGFVYYQNNLFALSETTYSDGDDEVGLALTTVGTGTWGDPAPGDEILGTGLILLGLLWLLAQERALPRTVPRSKRPRKHGCKISCAQLRGVSPPAVTRCTTELSYKYCPIRTEADTCAEAWAEADKIVHAINVAEFTSEEFEKGIRCYKGHCLKTEF